MVTSGNRSSLKNLDENSNTANIGSGSIGVQLGMPTADHHIGSGSPLSVDSNHGSGGGHTNELEHPHHLSHQMDRSAKSKWI